MNGLLQALRFLAIKPNDPNYVILGELRIREANSSRVVVLTIWDADAETKLYWRSPDGNAPRTTVIPGRGVQTFQTVGEFKLEAVGEPNHEVQYGYMLLGLRK
jgi:hypothetical protein